MTADHLIGIDRHEQGVWASRIGRAPLNGLDRTDHLDNAVRSDGLCRHDDWD